MRVYLHEARTVPSDGWKYREKLCRSALRREIYSAQQIRLGGHRGIISVTVAIWIKVEIIKIRFPKILELWLCKIIRTWRACSFSFASIWAISPPDVLWQIWVHCIVSKDLCVASRLGCAHFRSTDAPGSSNGAVDHRAWAWPVISPGHGEHTGSAGSQSSCMAHWRQWTAQT